MTMSKDTEREIIRIHVSSPRKDSDYSSQIEECIKKLVLPLHTVFFTESYEKARIRGVKEGAPLVTVTGRGKNGWKDGMDAVCVCIIDAGFHVQAVYSSKLK